VWAQDTAAVEQRVEVLRQQLRDVTDKQSQLQSRAGELDEALKPENVERSVAGIGTTDASALRDRRREQLEREKAVVDEQLRSLDASRARLEAAIASAEAEAVRLRASALAPNNSPPRDNAVTTNAPAASASPAKQNGKRVVKRRKRARRRASSR
jgi:chromosome segregation ATPase